MQGDGADSRGDQEHGKQIRHFGRGCEGAAQVLPHAGRPAGEQGSAGAMALAGRRRRARDRRPREPMTSLYHVKYCAEDYLSGTFVQGQPAVTRSLVVKLFAFLCIVRIKTKRRLRILDMFRIKLGMRRIKFCDYFSSICEAHSPRAYLSSFFSLNEERANCYWGWRTAPSQSQSVAHLKGQTTFRGMP